MTTKKRKILVIDDDAGILEVVRIILEEKDFEVMTASEGRGIRRRIEKYLPNVVLIDLWMSGMDGEEIIKKLKGGRKTKHIPVVAMSALGDGRTRAEDSGADDFVGKPFDIDELASLMKKYARSS